ncbi:hypothetical protein SPRG_10012 [Saprolegnia parasitica CBS 223.65]|uniref:PTM/DIR17-like Tudor domain-containing protein n=1 Tax=Saprolegnia parasitica (strain CBS 223.65) TaxID=695850 RepID=A0A067BXI1_SAPPC|nr:hypothetical protein SPRG_10012 [Saprolegnia parasitica CBS 223.65]KDO23204.1 hypothetical protein SPRG_10012 [Saprolegnia parasitica CBS 223.65]|eukprot:XP_012206155.1 hypothetical protein SPRG_10012 [Saprolegnia parasitica CBS 223.65]
MDEARQEKEGGRPSPMKKEPEKKPKQDKGLPSVPMLRPRPVEVHNGSETESDSETSQRQGVPSDIQRTGAMLTNLLARGEMHNDRHTQEGSLRRVPELPKPHLRKPDGDGPLPQLHGGAGDMRLPALTMNNLMRQNQGGPPAPGPPALPSSSHLSDMHMRGPPPPLQAPPRMDMSMNRPSPGGPPSWPSSRPQIESEPPAMKRPNSPPRERSMPYQQAPGPQLSVQAPRDDYDYPTYQPPEALVGQRIAKTFAGHGRFVGQVVKFNPQTELFTVVYADGDTEELTRENTMNLLIEDKRPEHMQAPAPSAAPPSNGGYKLAISDRERDILTALFEKHAWPLLAEHGWKSEMHGASFFFYPPWAGKSTREPEYFNSVLDAMKYISMHAELMRLCFPVEIQGTILSIFDQNKAPPPQASANGNKRHLDSDGPSSINKRPKPESPPARGGPPPMMGRPYYESSHHPALQAQQHAVHGHHAAYEYPPEPSQSRPGLSAPPPSRYPATAGIHRHRRRGRQASPRFAMGAGGPPPATSAPTSRPQMFHDGYQAREYERSRAPPANTPYMMPSPRHHPGMENVPRGAPAPSRTGHLTPVGYAESPREAARLSAPAGGPSPGMHRGQRVMMYPPGTAPPSAGPPGASSARDSIPTAMHGRYAPPPSNPRGPMPRGMISIADLDKSASSSGRLPPPPSSDGRMRMFPGDAPPSAGSYPPIASGRRQQQQQRAPGYPDQAGFRREEPRMYPPADRYAAMPPPETSGYYERGMSRYPPVVRH